MNKHCMDDLSRVVDVLELANNGILHPFALPPRLTLRSGTWSTFNRLFTLHVNFEPKVDHRALVSLRT